MESLEREWSDRGLSLEPGAEEPSEAESLALERGAILVPLPDSGLLRLAGADRVDFLHGQVSNEVRGLKPGQSSRSLLLNHKGHALADMRILRGEETLEVVVDGGALAVVAESLRRHIIFDQVELTMPADSAVVTLQGPSAPDVLGRALVGDLPAASEFVAAEFRGAPVTVVASSRTASGGFDLLVPIAAVGPLGEALLGAGAEAGSRPALELARVSAGIASATAEAGEGVLPQEAGLEPLVSYHKGCYLGQEIMARIEARGKLRRELRGLRLDGVPAPGERSVTLDGKTVGRLGRVVKHPVRGVLALAVLRSDLPEGATLAVDGVEAREIALPLTGSAVAG